MKILTMHNLMTMTKGRLRQMTGPHLIMAGPKKDKQPIAVILPYDLFMEVQAMRDQLRVGRFE